MYWEINLYRQVKLSSTRPVGRDKSNLLFYLTFFFSLKIIHYRICHHACLVLWQLLHLHICATTIPIIGPHRHLSISARTDTQTRANLSRHPVSITWYLFVCFLFTDSSFFLMNPRSPGAMRVKIRHSSTYSSFALVMSFLDIIWGLFWLWSLH